MNVIATRIADFFKEHLPFSKLSFEQLTEIATHVRVINLEKDTFLFQIDDSLHDSFYVVASGTINLSVFSDAEEILVNKCVEGEILGLRPFFAKSNYKMTAKAREESILYAIPITVFKPFIVHNTDILDFLLENFATNSANLKSGTGVNISDHVFQTSNNAESQFFQTLSYTKSPITISANKTVLTAATIMTDNKSDYIVVEAKNNPIGIITDQDIRQNIATGRYDIHTELNKIMSSPVIAVPENISLAEAQLLLLQNNISHLVVTQDGTDKSLIKGIITEHDLIVAQASNPGILIKEIKRAEDAKDLRKVRLKLTELIQNSLEKNIPISHIFNISGEINTAITKRAVELAIVDIGSAPCRFGYFSIGSQGRKEQLLLTDQDSILVFEDVKPEKYRETKEYFSKLAKKVVQTLEKVGYLPSPDGINATNMLWCKSLTDWIKQYDTWMKTPGENNSNISSIFFDFDLVIGEIKIEETLLNLVAKNALKNVLFFDYLGNQTLRKPAPLGFFKKFNLEENGIYKDLFDLKSRTIMPLVAGARIFALNHHIKGTNNTYLRFKQLAIVDAENAEIYLNCAEAFLTLTKFRTQNGLNNDNDGQYLDIEKMTKIDKEKLKNALAPMKELEELIKDTFQLTHFS